MLIQDYKQYLSIKSDLRICRFVAIEFLPIEYSTIGH